MIFIFSTSCFSHPPASVSQLPVLRSEIPDPTSKRCRIMQATIEIMNSRYEKNKEKNHKTGIDFFFAFHKVLRNGEFNEDELQKSYSYAGGNYAFCFYCC